MMVLLSVYENTEYGIESHVRKINSGFSVVLKDTDADEFVSMSYIYQDEAAAHEMAKKIVS